MKNQTRRIAFLTALAVAVGLLALLERPPEDQPRPIASPPAAAVPAPAEPPVFAQPATATEPPVVPRASIFVRDDPKQVPALENSQAVAKGLISPPELAPVAAVGNDAGNSHGAGAPEEKPAPEKPDSLFGWGPWSAGGPPTTTTGAPVPSGDGVPNVPLPAPVVSAASPPGGSPPPVVTPPPVVVPPPVTDPIFGGNGWGDRNHTHIHRRDR